MSQLSELLAPYGIILNKEGAALYLRNKKKGSITYRHVTDNPVHKAILEDICATHKDIKAEDLSKRLAKHGITLNKEEAGLYLRNKKKGSTCYAHVTDNPVHKIILEGICETHKGIQAKDLPKLLAPHGITLSTGGAYNYMSNKKQQPKAPKGLKRLRKNRGDPSIGPNRKYRRLRAK